MAHDPNEAPNKLPLPPLLTVGIILFGLVLDRVIPFGLGEQRPPVLTWLGLSLTVAAIGIDIWAFATFRRHGANIRPDRAATALITDGPFAWSRNPIYLANVMLTAGIGLAADNMWVVLGAALLCFALWDLAISREEAHMAAKFPDQWPRYTALVRRWL